MFKESPLVVGSPHPGGFYRPYLGRFDLPGVSGADAGPWAHNLALEMLAERGRWVVGFLSVPLRASVWLVPREPHARPLPSAAGGLTTFLVMGLFDLTFLKDWPQLLYWLLAALAARLPMLSGGPSRRSPG
jgi:hypothetical protein